MLMIKFLSWDTSFFGYKVGESNFIPNFQEADEAGYRLLYVRLKTLQEIPSASYIDHRVEFYKDVFEVFERQKLYSLLGHELTPELIHLSELSGIHSRYKLDPNFKNQEFEKLYFEWIRKSLSGEMANEVLAYIDSGEILGFVTIKLKGEQAHIGLIAVNEKAQGKGVGSALLKGAENFAFEHNAKTIHVPTQKNNHKACQFYSKAGYLIENEEFIYQVWF